MAETTQKRSQPTTAQNKMLRGSAWMTAGSIFSRILGAIYVIPWPIWFGVNFLQANSLFGRGYQVYSVFIVISTAGIPGALSKQIAKYNAMNEYEVGQRLFKKSLIMMAIMGVISAALLYSIAPVLAANDARMIPVFRSLSFPLMIIPILSIMRGYFQGYTQMAPSAISQFIEQVVRVFYMTASTYVIMVGLKGSYVTAVTHATFAAFIGAVAGLILLIAIYYRQKPKFVAYAENSNHELEISTTSLLKEIIGQSVPFIVIDASINLVYLFDQFTFNKMMHDFVIASDHQLYALYTLFAVNSNKLISITISLAAAMAVTAVPLMSAARVKNDHKALADQIGNILQLFSFVMIPASLGMMAVAQPLNTVFYSYDASGLGVSILQYSCIIGILLGLFTILSAMLQGLYRNKLVLMYLFVGFGVKIISQYPLIYFLRVYGPLTSTGLAFLVSSICLLYVLATQYHFNVGQTLTRLLMILIFASTMAIIVILISNGLNHVFNPASRVLSMVNLMVSATIGGLIYLIASLKTRLADQILGRDFSGLRRKLLIK